MLSNQKIIDEIEKSKIDFIKSRPKMYFKPFVSNKAGRDYNLGDNRGGMMGGYKSIGHHPKPGNNAETLYIDPLFGGSKYNNYGEFINRGGALLDQKMPLTGGYHSDSDYSSSDYSSSDYSSSDSSSESESDYETESEYESESDYESHEEGGNKIYDQYIKPSAKALYDVGKEVGKYAIPIAKELGKEAWPIVKEVGKDALKASLVALLAGAGRMKGGLITGTKEEYIHILKKINPNLSDKELQKKTKQKLSRELYQILEIGMHPHDLETLHYLDSLYHTYGEKGGLNGTKKELETILKKMYPQLDLKKMSKEQIIKEILKDKDTEEEEEEKIVVETIVKKKGRPKSQKSILNETAKLDSVFKKQADMVAKEIKADKKNLKSLLKKKPKPKSPSKAKAPAKPKGRPKSQKSILNETAKLDSVFKKQADMVAKQIKEDNKKVKPLLKKKKTKKELHAEQVQKEKERMANKKERARLEKIEKNRNKLTWKKHQIEQKMNKAIQAKTKDKYKAEVDKIEQEIKDYDTKHNYVHKTWEEKNNERLKSLNIEKEKGTKKRTRGENEEETKKRTRGGKINKIIGTKRGEKVRGDVIAEYMKKHNVSLGEASKKVKELGLY
jgi:hypothetical protein